MYGEPVDLFATKEKQQQAAEREAAAAAVGEELTAYAATLPKTRDRHVLHKSLLHLQRQFGLHAYRLQFAEMEPLINAYLTALQELEDLLYELDMEPPPAPIVAAPAGEVEPEDVADSIGLYQKRS